MGKAKRKRAKRGGARKARLPNPGGQAREPLAKVYDPAAVEDRVYAAWETEGHFHPDASAPGKPFTIVIPPPNVTDRLHLGHALNNALQDILVRWRRMQGRKTLWLPGMDHAGIATQAVVERRLFEEEGKTRHDVGRDGLVERIWAWRERSGDLILRQLRRIGCSCDWERARFTLDEMCARAVRHAFYRMFCDGLIYRGKRLVNWDTHLQTAVADDEVYHETVQGHLWHVRYPVKGEAGRFVTVATTRPETMLGDTAVAVHPDDERYKDLIGKTAILPLLEREIPVIADRVLVDPEFGSGCVKVTPAHDPNDYETGLRHNLEMINILTPDGRINENGGPYAGMDRYEARGKVVADLEAQGLIEKVEEYETDIGHSDRSKTPIEPYLSDQWFVRMADLAERAMEAVAPRDGTEPRVRFHPERYARGYLDWLGQKRDWCISRQLWWGHQIPIWHCATCGEEDLKRAFADRDDVAWRKDEARGGWVISSRDEDLAHDAVPGHRLERDPDVLDTWFSSAMWPFSTLGWPDETADLEAFYPTDVLVTAREIITLWVARMVMMGLYSLGEVPFRDVYIHAMIQDGEGRPMKKSLGNGVDPLDIVASHGADALRFTLAYMTTETQDVRMPVEVDPETGRNTSPKFDMGRNFCNKLWNAARFALMNLEGAAEAEFDKGKMRLEDRWILSRSERTLRELDAELSVFHFQAGLNLLYDFFWHELCDKYIEEIKPRLRDPATRELPQRVLAFVLDRSLRMIHPFVPFITEAVWEGLNSVMTDRELPGLADAPPSERVIAASWPSRADALLSDNAERDYAFHSELLEHTRNVKAEAGQARREVHVYYPQPGPRRDFIQSTFNDYGKLVGVSAVTFGPPPKGRPAASTYVPSTASSMHVVWDLGGHSATFSPVDIDAQTRQFKEAQRQRLQKQIDDNRNLLDKIMRNLDNPNFLEKAAPEAVERERRRAGEVRAAIQSFEKDLPDLG